MPSALAPQFTRQETLDAGQYRFEKDGLWVVGQEDSWQEGNKVILARKAALGQVDNAAPKHPNATSMPKSSFRSVSGKELYCREFKKEHTIARRNELAKVRLADEKIEREALKKFKAEENARAKVEAEREERRLVREREEREAAALASGAPLPAPPKEPELDRKQKMALLKAKRAQQKMEEELKNKPCPRNPNNGKYSFTHAMAARELAEKYDGLPREEQKVRK